MDESLSISARCAYMMLQIGFVIFAAHFAGYVFNRFKIPSVLGELMTGVLLGPYLLGSLPLTFVGLPAGLFPLPSTGSALPVSNELYFLSTLGSIVLLFMSGLETDLKMFLKYSIGGTMIGIGGVVVSFVLGDLTGIALLHAGFSDPRCLFLGILCTATSVGITARILSEKHSLKTPEGTSIMAAAVIDDVLGIICLAVVLGIIAAGGSLSGNIDWKRIGFISIKSVTIWLFFTAGCLIFAHRFARVLKIFKDEASYAVLGLGGAIFLAGIFENCGLAMIIGAYCAGLGLCRTDIAYAIQNKLRSIYEFLVPIFFVIMGMLVDVRVFTDRKTLMFGLLYSLMAIIAKIVGCMAPALFMNFNPLGALRIGMGMIPRGEVALIIAGIGATTLMPLAGQMVPIINSQLLGVTVIMTLVTTLAAPPLLAFVLGIKKRGVRHETKDMDTIQIPWRTKSHTVREFMARELMLNFQKEGFNHSDFSLHNTVVHFRKENITFVMQMEDDTKAGEYGITLECTKAEAVTIQAIFLETIAEIHQIFDKIKRNLQTQTQNFGGLWNGTSPVIPYSADNEYTIEKILPENCVLTDLESTKYEDAIREIILYLHRLGYIKDRERCLRDVMTREQIDSTLIEDHYVALPHARTTQVLRLVSVLALCYIADKGKTLIIVLTLCPKDEDYPYMQYIAHMASVLLAVPDLDAVRKIEESSELRQIFM